jgi:transcriptional regulator with XRE-family HTH domain
MRQIRLEMGLSQKELSNRTHLAPSMISSLEKGTVHPSVRTVELLSQVLGKSTAYLTNPEVEQEDSSQTAATYDKPALPEKAFDPFQLLPANEYTTSLSLALALLRQGKYELALDELQHLDDDVSNAENPANELQKQYKNFLYAQIYNRTRKTKQARELLKELRQNLESIGSGLIPLAEIYFELGLSYSQERQVEEAIEHYNMALTEAGSLVESSKLGLRLYADLAQLYQQLGMFDQAQEYYAKVAAHPLYTQDDRTRATSLQTQAIFYIKQNQHAKGLELLAESIQLYEKLELLEHAQTVSSYYQLMKVQHVKDHKPEEMEELLIEPANLALFNPVNQLTILGNKIAYLRGKADSASITPEERSEFLAQALDQLTRIQPIISNSSQEISVVVQAQVSTEEALLYVTCDKWLGQSNGTDYRQKAIQVFDATLTTVMISKVPYPHFQKVYDAYEEALLDWNMDKELAQLARLRREERRNVANF